jgi:flagellar hook protein FlgE
VTSDGGFVLGYPAVNGVISPSATLAPLQISSGEISQPNATTNVELTMNLNASGAAQANATGTLTATGNAHAGDTVTIGNTTYTFVTALSASPTVPNQVLISNAATGAEAATLANLAAAINGSGQGTTCSIGTVGVPSVIATAGATTLSLLAVTPGSADNSIVTTVSLFKGSSFGAAFGAATLTGGANASLATSATGTLTTTGNAVNGDEVTVGGETYTLVTTLGATPNEVYIDPAGVAGTLTNLAAAINGTGTAAQVSPGTSGVATVTATAGATSLALSATAGKAGNSIGTAVTLEPTSTFGASFGANTTLTGGADASPAVAATATLNATGNASAGDTVTIAGTTYTFVTALTATSNEVLIDPTAGAVGEANTLANLAAAINGTGQGKTCSTGTVANGSVTATSAATSVSLTATTAGSAEDTLGTTVSLVPGSSFGAAFGASTMTGGVTGASFSEPVVVYDSLGNSHTITFNFTKTAANTWSYQITIPAADVTGASAPVVLNSGTLTFDGNGNLTSPAANVTGITVANLADGAKSMNFTWQLFDPTTGALELTQTAGTSNVSSTQVNGNTSGALQSFSITSDGTIQGVFSNGQTLTLGQLALASFPNDEGLLLNGSNTYLASPSAGIPSIGTPDTGGRGTIVGQSLESSNVDMTTELANLIVAERNYQSNARAISTADQMINYVLTMQP